MLKRMTTLFGAAAIALAALAAAPADAAEKSKFRIAWSIYVGWMPWGHAADAGIVKKWADKYGIEIDVVQINDYVESINQYTAGAFDGCVMTNMDALSIPAGGGVDSTALIVGDFSNGNDAILIKGKGDVEGLKGKRVNLVELSVSHYLLARALDGAGLKESDITVVNTSDADMVAAFNTKDVVAAVTWNPLVFTIMEQPNVSKIFDSSKIPGEIIDMMVVNTATLRDNPKLGKALVGAWYEMMALMSKNDMAGKAARTRMAEASGTNLAGYDAQLATTEMYDTPAEAVAFTTSPKLVQTMDYVRRFLFAHGILGEGAKTPDHVGMSFPGGTTLGNTGNVRLRFDPSYMKMAADGAL